MEVDFTRLRRVSHTGTLHQRERKVSESQFHKHHGRANSPADMGAREQHNPHGHASERGEVEGGPIGRRHILLRRGGAGQVPAREALDQRPPLLQARQDLRPCALEDGRARPFRWDHRGYGPHAGQDGR